MISLFHRLSSICAIVVFGLVCYTSDAHAWLKICNKTSATLKYHHSQPDSGCGSDNCAWRKKGWWTIAPNTCMHVYESSANNKWFYYYAQNVDGSSVYTGSWAWSVNPDWFDSVHDNHNECQCNACGSFPPGPCSWFGHRELHTTATDFTLNLTN